LTATLHLLQPSRLPQASRAGTSTSKENKEHELREQNLSVSEPNADSMEIDHQFTSPDVHNTEITDPAMETEEMIETEDTQEDGMHIEVEPNPSMVILDTQDAEGAGHSALAHIQSVVRLAEEMA